MKPTEQRIYNFIKQYHEEHSLMPTVREICKGLGFKSTSSVAYHLANLVEKGELTNLPNKSRAYRLANNNTLSFKAKWDRLRDFISEEKSNNSRLDIGCCESTCDLILDKMKELENGEWE